MCIAAGMFRVADGGWLRVGRSPPAKKGAEKQAASQKAPIIRGEVTLYTSVDEPFAKMLIEEFTRASRIASSRCSIPRRTRQPDWPGESVRSRPGRRRMSSGPANRSS